MTTNKIYIRSTASLVAATIGAGIFGIPFVMSQSGILVGVIWLVLMAGVMMLLNLLMGEVALRMPDNLRFMGLAREILPKPAALLTQLLMIFTYLGGLLAYLILGGKFLQTLLNLFIPVTVTSSTLLYFVITALLLRLGFGFLKKIDVFLIGLLSSLVLLLIVICLPKMEIANFTYINLKQFFLPYGVTLFALTSASVIPTLEASLRGNKQMLRKIITTGSLIAAGLTLFFGVAISSVSGLGTSQDAFTGLASYFGPAIIVIGSLFGLIAMIGVNTMLANTLKENLQFDYKVPEKLAFLIVVTLPLLIILAAQPNFIEVLSIVGGVFGGLLGAITGWMSLRSHHLKTRQPEYCLKHDRFWAKLIIVAFCLGAIYEIYFSLIK